MSDIIFPKQFINTYKIFKKTSFSQESKEKDNKKYNRDGQKTRDSLKILSNIKTVKNFRKSYNIRNNKKPINNLTPLNKEKFNQKQINNSQQGEHKKVFGFIFNKAPTLRQNQIEINKIIKNKKIKLMKEINNIYNNILIRESKSFRNSLYTGNTFYSNTNNKIRRNRSCDEYSLLKLTSYKSTKEIQTSNNDNSIFSKTGFNYNISNNRFKEKKQINKSAIFHELSKSKISDNIIVFPSLANTFTKNNNIASSIKSITKMRMQVNDAIFNDLKKIKEFTDIEKQMMLFNMFQNIQSNEVNNVNILKEKYLDYKLNMLTELKNEIIKKNLKYANKMNNYLYFLKDKFYEEKDELHFLEKETFNNKKEFEKVIIKALKKQEELEYLINVRNFLLQVKEKYEQNEKSQSAYFELLIKDSKKLLLGNFLLNSKVINHISNKSLNTFIGSILDLKQNIEDNKIYINNYDYNTNNLEKEKIKPIFESPEEFMKLYNLLMEKNLAHLQELEFIKKNLNKLKIEYDQALIIDNNNNPLGKEIKIKEKIKEQLIQNNEILKNKYIKYKENIIKRSTQIEINSKIKKNNMPKYLDIEIDLDSIRIEKYKKKVKNLKYNGLLLFDKIIKIIKFFFREKYLNDFFINFKKENLKILELSGTSFTNENIQLLDIYIKKLLSIYEDICKYVLLNHSQYLLNKNNLELIHKMEEEINNERRKKICKEQKKIQSIKNIEEKNKILEKFYKPIYFIENKMNTDTKIKRRTMMKIKSYKKLEDEEKNYAENEFNSLTKYNDKEDML